MIHRQIRQGDVLLVPIEQVPPALQREGTAGRQLIIAEGEATGHAHTVDAESATLWTGDEETRFLEVLRECALVHQEHSAITLAPGAYRIVHQREYSPGEIRRVVD